MSQHLLNRAPAVIWSLRQAVGCGYVRTLARDQIGIVLPVYPESSELMQVVVSRKDARLLAKRLNQCLDETRR
jgi:hypothetical protein